MRRVNARIPGAFYPGLFAEKAIKSGFIGIFPSSAFSRWRTLLPLARTYGRRHSVLRPLWTTIDAVITTHHQDGSPARRTTRGFAPTPSHSRSHSHPSCPARHPSSLQAAADTNLPRSPPTCREPFPLCRRQHRHERPRAQECGGVHTTPALLRRRWP